MIETKIFEVNTWGRHFCAKIKKPLWIGIQKGETRGQKDKQRTRVS